MYIDVNEYVNCSCDSDMIQSALDEARVTGAAVVIPRKNCRTGKQIWDISKTIYVYSESIVILQNCHMRLADGAFCHMFANFSSKEGSKEIDRNIHIMGMGKAVLDGGIHNGVYEENGIARKVTKPTVHKAIENRMMVFKRVENLVVENILIKDQRYWGISLLGVTYSRISNIRFSSSSNVPNQDGLGISKGCHDLIVENISGCVGDNLIAICAMAIPPQWDENGDIYNITVRNVMGYGVGGCSIIRILNHDGYKVYNIYLDNIIETSPWSENDASVAPNPDLAVRTDAEGNIIPYKKLIPGEKGYRCEAAIIIGESYWYGEKQAVHGETYGIRVSNVMTHARYAIWVNNTLLDSSFDNIRLFGNGFMAAYFGEGHVENLRFSNISYDKNCRPLKSDNKINIEWNNTKSEGFSCVYFNGTQVENVSFKEMHCSQGMETVFGGNGHGNVICENIYYDNIPSFERTEGIEFLKK